MTTRGAVVRGRSVWGLAVALLVAPACGGEVVTLGQAPGGSAPLVGAPRFGEPRLVPELASDEESDNPTLTADLLEIYFASGRDGGAGDVDVWTARRATKDAPFAEPTPVSAVNSDDFETSPAVSLDGLELYVGAERDGGVGEEDIWVSRRGATDEEWPELTNVAELNSDDKDIPRPPALGGRVMPLGSRRGESGFYETFLATRATPSEPFGEPVELFELEEPEQNSVDGFLTEDGLTLLFNRTPGAGEDTGDLFVARRASVADPFGPAAPLDDLNTEHDERDPWLSPDGQHLFFSSDRDGTLSIYEAISAN